MPADEVPGGGREQRPQPPGSGRNEERRRSDRRTRLNERRTEIAKVFAEIGFMDLLERSGLRQYAPLKLKARQTVLGEPGASDQPARLRRGLEQLGGAFVKLGQTLSSRPDLVPPEYIAELERLQDSVPPMPFETVRQVVESELECPLEDGFATFEESPLGSGSIGQVHVAILHDGAEVVVKVQRPEAPTLIDLDLDLMTRAARRLAGAGWARDADPVGTMAEFAEAVRSELDFSTEARNLDCFNEFFAEDDTVRIPVAVWEHTTSRLLTESRLEGIPLSRPDEIRAAGGDVHQLVQHGVDAYLRMVFELRRFHSDPHAGNLLALQRDAIGFVDFGRVSTLSERGLDRASDCLMAFASNDASGVTECVLEITRAGDDVDSRELRRDIEDMMNRYARAEIAQTMGHSVLSETLEITRRHGLRMPSEYAMLFQTFGVLQGVVLGLDPKTRLLDVMEPYIKRVTLERTPERLGREVLSQIGQYARLIARLPEAVESGLRRLTLGELDVKIKMDQSEEVLDRAEAVANRFSLTLLLSAMAIALALTSGQPVLPPWVRSATNVLLLLVVLVAVWLFVSIAAAERRGRRRRRGSTPG